MELTLHIWRQNRGEKKGCFKMYHLKGLFSEMSFLEMLDVLNEQLIEEKKEEPIVFDHDCREGICGACSLLINGNPHGPHTSIATCQLHLRSFKDGDHVWIEPFRARSFPVIQDLMVDRGAFDRIIEAGGYVSVNTGAAPEAHTHPVKKEKALQAFDNATCIGCGACVAVCKNASASLFVASKLAHLALLPQGSAERKTRVKNMVEQMEKEGFGSCSNTGACSKACPKDISIKSIVKMNREYGLAYWK